MDKRTQLIRDLCKKVNVDFGKFLNADTLTDMILSWKEKLDNLKVPDDDIYKLYDYALQEKKDMLNFGIIHIVQAYPSYKALKARKMYKESCPVCYGKGFKMVNEQKVTCWMSHN